MPPKYARINTQRTGEKVKESHQNTLGLRSGLPGSEKDVKPYLVTTVTD